MSYVFSRDFEVCSVNKKQLVFHFTVDVWADLTRAFVTFLNGNNGEWTNGDDLADRNPAAGNAERKRTRREADTNIHRSTPGRFKGKRGPGGDGAGRGGSGAIGGRGRGRDTVNPRDVGGRGRGRGGRGSYVPHYNSEEAREMREEAAYGDSYSYNSFVPGVSTPNSGVPSEDDLNAGFERLNQESRRRAAERAQREQTQSNPEPESNSAPGDSTHNEETDKPHEETEFTGSCAPRSHAQFGQNPDYWFQDVLEQSRAILVKEREGHCIDMVVDGNMTQAPRDMRKLRVDHLSSKHQREALKIAEGLIKKSAITLADEVYHQAVSVEQRVINESRRILRERQYNRMLADAIEEPVQEEAPRVKVPLVVRRNIPIKCEEPPCCSFGNWFGFGWLPASNNNDIEGDNIEAMSIYEKDDDAHWRLKLGYNRSYDGVVYMDLVEHLKQEYLPTATYTESVLSRMHYDSVKWYENQRFTEPIHLAIETNTINWVVVQNQIARARNSSRLGLGPVKSFRVAWK